MGQPYALPRAEKLIHEAGALTAADNKLSGAAQARFATGWRPLAFTCTVDGADRVSHLTYQYTGPVKTAN